MLKLRGQVSSPFKPSFFFFFLITQVFHHRPQLWPLLCKGGIKQALSILLEYAEFLYILWQCQMDDSLFYTTFNTEVAVLQVRQI